MPPGYAVTWKVLPLLVDGYEPPVVFDPARESMTTLAQGLTSARHTLEVEAGGGTVPIRAIRIYRAAGEIDPPYGRLPATGLPKR